MLRNRIRKEALKDLWILDLLSYTQGSKKKPNISGLTLLAF